MWQAGWRDRVWSQLDKPWDLVVIGGGIVGAGILREASRAGLRVLLVEAGDFASGTSSRSSKLVHGGFRYLQYGQVRLTLESVRERERLLRQGKGLITPMGFLLANYAADRLPAWVYGIGLIVYDLLAGKWGHRHYNASDLRELCPQLNPDGLVGGYRYIDAKTDDARLVLRLILEAVAAGGMALNYAHADSLLCTRAGRVCGVVLSDRGPGHDSRQAELQAQVVINATGAWADKLVSQVGTPPRLRRLRGSHLFFPTERLPLSRSVSIRHPIDQRPVFAFPWEGVTLLGTTDVDHRSELTSDPAIDSSEVEYLMAAVHHAFPEQALTTKDVISTLAGLRAVIDTGKADPSKESREHVLSQRRGLLTVTGGKLTTFRLMAHDALHAVRSRLATRPSFSSRLPVLNPLEEESALPPDLEPPQRLRLLGRYGEQAKDLIAAAMPGELEPIGSTPALWVELRWCARSEGVVHLDDLMLRRLRLGLTLPEGGLGHMDRIRGIVQPELGWDDARWQQEAESYALLWRQSYYLP
ncbi:MAG: glycerol-3-phosphate dehydrogenase/oxidase [Anaerolineales bacterium]|jgi:glycerol-3-phosphate dehydrogenase